MPPPQPPPPPSTLDSENIPVPIFMITLQSLNTFSSVSCVITEEISIFILLLYMTEKGKS